MSKVKAVIDAVGRGLDRYFFLPERPEPLALCRAVACGAFFVYFALFDGDFRGWLRIADVYYEPEGVWRFYWEVTRDGLPILGDAATWWAQTIFKVALLLGCVGLFTRVSMWVAFACGFFLLGLSTGFGKVSHSEPACVWMLLILAMSRCGDAWSLDRALFRRGEARKAWSGEYRWPLRMVWVVMALVFGLAGWSKLIEAGPRWMHPDSFTPLMLSHYYENDPPTELGLRLAWFRPFVWAGSVSTLVGECLFPLALVSRRARLVLVPLMFGMQLNITALFGVYFWAFLPGYAFWVPWGWLLYDRRVPWGEFRSLPPVLRSLSKRRETAGEVDARPAGAKV